MFRSDLLPLPVHAGGLPVVNLHTVHADVAFAAPRVPRNDARQGDESAAVERPALQHGKVEHAEHSPRRITCLQGASFACTVSGKNPPDRRQHGQHLQLVHQTFRRLQMEQALDAPSHIVKLSTSSAMLHAPLAAELVHQHAAAGIALHVFKQQGCATGDSAALT